MLIFKNKNQINEEIIEQFEKDNNLILPESYKKFLLKYNGGETYKTELRNIIYITHMFGLNTGDIYDLNTIIQYELPERLAIEHDLLNICDSILGDCICIRINNPNDDSVWLKYHDRPSKPKKLADSFKEFIQKCKSEKIGHISTIEERWEHARKNGLEHKVTPNLVKFWERDIIEMSNLKQEEVIID